MRDKKLDRLFDRYRSKGDARALGRVFDGTAPELLRVAASLVRDPQEADDLLQATYLTAIERAEHWDASRRLVPWLLGILVRHAHEMRRDRMRTPDPERVLAGREPPGDPADPADAAARTEAFETLGRTIDALPSPYREVLEPFVREGRQPAEIAAAIGRAPGTVRMQLHRGLDLLRKALPAGLALGALAANAGPGLDAVRSFILRRAAERAGELAALGSVAATAGTSALSTMTGLSIKGGLSTKGVLGGLSMTKKFGLIAVSIALMSGIAWLGGSLAEPASEPLVRESTLRLEGEGAGELAVARTEDERREEVSNSATPPDTETFELEAEPAPASYERALAGMTGRVVEEDGSPVAGVSVALHELGYERLESALDDVFSGEDPPDWIVSRTVTDDEGNFTLGRARADALHGIGVDVGGARPSFQVLDVTLNPGEVSDVGTITLARAIPVRGRVVDRKGAPIVGARVRAVRLTGRGYPAGFRMKAVDWLELASLRPTTPVFAGQSLMQMILQVPASTARLEASFPLATATTGADGEFVIAGAPAEGATLFVDHPGWVSLEVDPGEPEEGVRDVGNLVLATGPVFTGKVVDAAGEAVAGAEVRAGALFEPGGFGIRVAVLASHAATSAAGGFTLTGVADGSNVVFAARRGPEHAWVLALPRDPGFVALTLPEQFTMEVRLSAADGARVDDAQLAVLEPPGLAGLAGLAYGPLLASNQTFGRFEKLGPGHYAIHELQKGSYVLRGMAPGYMVSETRLRVSARAAREPAVLTFEQGRSLDVQVVDAAGAPVERASVALMEGPDKALRLARAVTGADGRARLEPVPAALPAGAHLRTCHPLHATRDAAVAPKAPEARVVLEAGGTLVLRVLHEGGPPPAPVTLDMDRRGEAAGSELTRRFGMTDAGGVIRVTHLAPGKWYWATYRRYLDDNVFALVSGETNPIFLGSDDVTIVAGETTEVVLDLTGKGEFLDVGRALGDVHGRVTMDGEPVPDLTLILNGEIGGSRRGETDADGSFELAGIPAGELHIGFFRTKEDEHGSTFTRVHAVEFELAEGESKRLAIEWQSTRVDVRVEGPGGGPLAAATVIARSAADRARLAARTTGEEGHAAFELKRGGKIELLALHDSGMGIAEVDLEPGDNPRATLRLAAGFACAGTLTLPSDGDFDGAYAQLSLSNRADARIQRSALLRVKELSIPFRIEGLPPGTYEASLIGIDVRFEDTMVEVPEGGVSGVELRLEPGDRR